MGVALVAGALLAKRKRYVAHGICQTTVLLLNLGMITLVMPPSFQHQVRQALPGSLHKWFYAVATIHSLVGRAASGVNCNEQRKSQASELSELTCSGTAIVVGLTLSVR